MYEKLGTTVTSGDIVRAFHELSCVSEWDPPTFIHGPCQ